VFELSGPRLVKTSVHIPEDLYLLARHLGLRNLNEFVRDALQGFVDGQEDPVADSVATRARQIAIDLRAKSMQQRKITCRTDEENAEIERLRSVRRARINEAVLVELHRIGADRFEKYLEDPEGDYQSIQDDIITAVGKASGYSVDLADVITAFKEVRA
jgi:hypothetical protein